MPMWTNEQLDAINKEGTNIIVSAGAGSGKTAVLSERVLRKLENGIDIDKLLILTFTKAAALEMKERIRKKIKQNDSLKNQLDLIDSAYITTFDSYALSIVKRYHYLLNVSKNVSIIETSIIDIEKEKLMDKIFENYYTKNNIKFEKLINDFCIKDDKEIKKYILNISNKLDMMYYKEEYLKTYLNNMFLSTKLDNDINEYTNLLKTKIQLINNDLNLLNHYVDSDYYSEIYDMLCPLIYSTNYEDIKTNSIVKLPAIKKDSDEEAKNIKTNISNTLKEIKSLTEYENIQDIKNKILLTKDYIEIIIEIILEFDNKIQDFKFKNDLYEFNDIAKMAIKILKENDDVVLEIKNNLNEILVDEYQDTNDLQEEFISLISNNNVYMVGDVKQSIYRFRNANPYIFKNKYDKYSSLNNGIKIDLNKNFRSRKEVLDDINLIFNTVMDNVIGGANYKETHQMIFGNNTYTKEGNTNQNNNLEIYNYEYDKNLGFTKEEVEIFIIAKDIKTKIENKYQIFDKDDLKLRDISYNDFVILMDRTTNFNIYKKIFEYLNIPLTVFKDENINNGNDIDIIRNIINLVLKVKNNIYDDDFKYSFISVARSFLYSLSDNDIFNYVLNNNYYDCEIIKIAKELADITDSLSCSELLNSIIKKFNYYEKLINVGNVEISMVRIEYLNNLSKSLSLMGYNINDFMTYLNELSISKRDIKFSLNTENDNSVKIMTIHKSKGLEYHVCYFAGLYAKFNTSDLKEKFIFDNTYGIISPYYDNYIGNTIYKSLLKDKYLKEEISEKIRLFYVALTRCKEKMIMVTSIIDDEIFNYDSNGVVNNNYRLKYTSFDDIIKSSIEKIKKYFIKININTLKLTKEYNFIKNTNYKSMINSTDEKIVVHELNIENNIIDNKHFSKTTNKLYNTKEIENMELGTKIHEILEIIDFKNPNTELLDIDDYYKLKIKKFLENDIFKDDIVNIYKEYEFMYKKEESYYHGIIDLIIEYDNDIKIIDYKLNNTKDEKYIDQLNGYRNYISTKTNKKVYTYLYSILNETLEKIQ